MPFIAIAHFGGNFLVEIYIKVCTTGLLERYGFSYLRILFFFFS